MGGGEKWPALSLPPPSPHFCLSPRPYDRRQTCLVGLNENVKISIFVEGRRRVVNRGLLFIGARIRAGNVRVAGEAVLIELNIVCRRPSVG